MVDALRALSRLASLALAWLAGAGLLMMTGIIFWQVVARYGFNASPAWAEQSALVLMIWFVFLAGAAGVREDFHIRIEAARDAAPRSLRRIMTIAAHLVVLMFGVGLFLWGVELVLRTWSHDLPSVPISRGMAYIPAPAGGLLISVYALEAMLCAFGARKTEGAWS